MKSFQIGISPSRRAAGRFISRVRRSLQRALVEEGERSGINQSKVAEAIGVHRSVISRELNGRQDITLGRIAELAWALGREIEFNLIATENDEGSNLPKTMPGALAKASLQPPIKIQNESDMAPLIFSAVPAEQFSITTHQFVVMA
jgi:transcriptional regulator with XRE-family HTH domain